VIFQTYLGRGGGKLLTALKLLVALVGGGSNPNKSLGGKLLTAL
jgi:hypothetical protein